MNSANRTADLRQILIERQRELQDDVQNRIRDGRINDQGREVGDQIDTSDAHVQGDIEFALLQMRAETLAKIGTALVQLEAGKYGTCLSCGGEITERRLRALPFAVRCHGCAQKREVAQNRSRHALRLDDGPSLFPA